jgi:hypothetical protein
VIKYEIANLFNFFVIFYINAHVFSENDKNKCNIGYILRDIGYVSNYIGYILCDIRYVSNYIEYILRDIGYFLNYINNILYYIEYVLRDIDNVLFYNSVGKV